MKRSYKVAGMVLVALLVVGLPTIRYQANVEVDVTWSVRETEPKDHVVTVADDSFTIPAGGTIMRSQRFRGGGETGLGLRKRGWGFSGQKLIVDGEVVSLSRIRSSDVKGSWEFFGIGRPPSMNAEIELE